MQVHRRQVLLAGGALLASCRSAARPATTPTPRRLDRLLAAHADALPENGGGANHYPMAAEALESLGREEAIEDSWIDGAALYAGEPPRRGAIDAATAPLGASERFGDLLDHVRAELAGPDWRPVVARWAPRLAPGISAAAFHGVIRTGHAVRALRTQDTPARRDELAVGLAYWAARHVRLPVTRDAPPRGVGIQELLEGLEHPWLDDRAEVGFHAVGERLALADRPVAPPLMPADPGVDPTTELRELVRAAAAGVLEMLVAERHRLWLMHSVTGPAAVDLILPEVDDAGARALVACARQAVVALFAAYGEPFTSRAHERAAPPDWSTLIQRAVATRSVHTIKLTEALTRFDADDDRLCRSVVAQWLEWV